MRRIPRPVARFLPVSLALALLPAAAQAGVVISQVYGGGGNSGAPYNRDFIELFNRGGAPLSLSGLSVQYGSATGTGAIGGSGLAVSLPAVTLQPGQYFLVQLAGGSNGAALPTPDATGGINLAATGGKVALVNGTASLGCNGGSLPCSGEQLARIVDLVGFGGANFFEGSAAAPAPGNATSAQRRNGGCTDTGQNGADFATGAPLPRTTATLAAACGDAPPPPPPPVDEKTIAQIQGFGVGTPLVPGTEVATEGVVTARRANGYFIQSATGEEDGDPATAEGLFVFTGAAPSADAAVGNRVRVTGRVSMFSRTPHGYPLTQLTHSTLVVEATGQPLPPAVVLDASVLSPGVPTAALGRYQGMRVELPAATVVGPTNAFGDFHVSLPGVARPAREPGIAVLDAVPLPPGNAIPRFDRNPERLRVESRGLAGGTALNVDAGSVVEGMAGILYYDRGDFTLLLGPNDGVAVSGGALVSAVPAAEEGAVRIASFNIENLSGGASVPLARLQKLSEVFCRYLDNPDIVGLVEIADLETAQRVAEAINGNEFGTCPASPAYRAYLRSTNGSQRLAYLVKTAPVAGGQPRVAVESVQQLAEAETLTAPDGSAGGLLFDRAPLHLVATVRGDNGEVFPVNVLLNHTLSLLEVNSLRTRADSWGTEGNRSRGKRRQQAVRLSQLVEGIQSADPSAPLVLIGDYNAFDFSDGYVDVMGIIAGTPAPADQVLVPGASAVTRPLVNLLGTKPAAQRYSYVFEGNVQTLDHALVNDVVLATTEARLLHARVNADFAVDNAADPTVPVRSSDHDPLVAELVVPRFLDADLAVDVTGAALPALDGQIVPFSVSVANRGVSRALRPELTLRLDARPAQVRTVAAAGWECAAPVAEGEGAVIFCGRLEPMAPGAVDHLSVALEAWRLTPIETLGVSAEAATRSRDVQPGNDAAAASVRVAGTPRRVH